MACANNWSLFPRSEVERRRFAANSQSPKLAEKPRFPNPGPELWPPFDYIYRGLTRGCPKFLLVARGRRCKREARLRSEHRRHRLKPGEERNDEAVLRSREILPRSRARNLGPPLDPGCIDRQPSEPFIPCGKRTHWTRRHRRHPAPFQPANGPPRQQIRRHSRTKLDPDWPISRIDVYLSHASKLVHHCHRTRCDGIGGLLGTERPEAGKVGGGVSPSEQEEAKTASAPAHRRPTARLREPGRPCPG